MIEGEPQQPEDEYLPGMRVAAIKETTEDGKVILYGFGIYEGDFVPLEGDQPNPRIKLDTGQTVWGFECWWIDQDSLLRETPTERIEFADIDQDRYREIESAAYVPRGYCRNSSYQERRLKRRI